MKAILWRGYLTVFALGVIFLLFALQHDARSAIQAHRNRDAVLASYQKLIGTKFDENVVPKFQTPSPEALAAVREKEKTGMVSDLTGDDIQILIDEKVPYYDHCIRTLLKKHTDIDLLLDCPSDKVTNQIADGITIHDPIW